MASLRDTQTGRTVAFDVDLSIGRSAASHLCLGERYVSKHHAFIRWSRDAWVVHDLASRNGTFVDGERIAAQSSAVLRPGTKVSFGARKG